MKKAFSFKEAPASTEPQAHELDINGELFELEPGISGIELLKLTGETSTTSGVHALLSRAIQDDDWDRFSKVTKHIQLRDFYRIAGAIIDLYAENPITAGADS